MLTIPNSRQRGPLLNDHIQKSVQVNFLTSKPLVAIKGEEVSVVVVECFKGLATMCFRLEAVYDRNKVDPALLKKPMQSWFSVNYVMQMLGQDALLRVDISYELTSALDDRLMSVSCSTSKDPEATRDAVTMFLVLMAENDKELPARWKFLNFGDFKNADLLEVHDSVHTPLSFSCAGNEERYTLHEDQDAILRRLPALNRKRYHELLGYVAVLRAMSNI